MQIKIEEKQEAVNIANSRIATMEHQRVKMQQDMEEIQNQLQKVGTRHAS